MEAAVERLCKQGPARFSPHEICADLSISKALVNYHFGGKDGLMAAAMVEGYERYVAALEAAAEAAGPEPIDKVMAWVETQIFWSVDNPGIGVALNYPLLVTEEALSLTPEHELRITRAGSRNQFFLWGLITDLARSQSEADLDVDDEHYLMVTSMLIAWLTLGISVWNSGQHLPTNAMASNELASEVRNRIRSTILTVARGQ